MSKEMEYPDTILLVTYTDDPGFFVYSDNDNLKFPRSPFFSSVESLTSWLEIDGAEFDDIDRTWPQLQHRKNAGQ